MDNALQELLYTLQEEPKPEEIKAQDGRLYVPIGFIEAKLDKIFHGLWKTENVQTTVIGNEVCMTLELHVYFYPINQWVVRTGAGAAMIQQRGDWDAVNKKKVPARPSDVDAKISNTLAKDYPHAKADLIVFHNASFDVGIISGEQMRLEYPQTSLICHSNKIFCTKEKSTNICKIPNSRGGYKWPSLAELCAFCGVENQTAHNALSDVIATKECYFYMVEQGYF